MDETPITPEDPDIPDAPPAADDGDPEIHDQPVEIGDALQGQPCQVDAVAVAVEGRVDVGAGIGDHRDPADLELDARRVVGAAGLPAQVIADLRPRQPRIGGHALVDGMREINQPSLGHRSYSA